MQMLQQQFTLSTNSPSNGPQQTFQLIQGPQGQIIAAATQQQQQRFANTNTATSNQNGKSTKVPQQILPKPNQPQFQSQIHLENISQLQQSLQPTTATQVHNPNQQHQKTKNSTNNSNNNNSSNNNSAINTSTNMSQHLSQISQSPQPTQQTTQQQILLPSGATASLTATQQPLLLNQVPVLVQQNTPQGVQLILRPPTPQLTATPSLVIQNTRPQPQLQAQQQPQQLLRILGTNGATMQLAAATPTFIVSSQANLIQQATNLQTIKTNPQTPAITQISGLHAALSAAAAANTQPRSQQFATTAATINGHLLGPSMAAQLQNLQLAAAAAANGNGITAQIQMPNGLNASTGPTLLSQLPAANFQQGTTSSLINLNQLNGTNIHQLAAAAAAAGATFQTPGVPTQSPASTSGNNGNAVSSNSNTSTDLFNGQSPAAGLTSLTQSPGPSSIAVTSEPMRQPAPVLQSIPASPQQVNGPQIQLSLNAAATIQLQQQQQQQQQAQIQQLQQQIQQTQNQVQQAQKQVQLQQQQPSEPTKKKPRPRKKKQPGASSLQNAAASNPTAINSVNSTPTTAAVVKTFTATTNRPLNTTTPSTIAIPTTITTSNSNITVPNSITANATLTTVTTTNHNQPYGNATTVQQESQMQMNLLSNQIAQVQQQPAKSPSPPPQITRASNGKLDLGNVMKLCGIMEDDDDEDYSMEACAVSASSGEIAQHQDNGHNNAEISISLPQTENHSGTLPYTLTIPATSTPMTGESNVPGPATNIVIKIDAGDSGLSSSASGTAPYSISIPSLPTAEEINAQAQQMATMSQQIKPTLPHVPTSINFSLPIGQIGSMTSTSFPTTGPIHNNIITSMAGRISTSTFSATNANVTAITTATVTATATTTTTTTTATVKPRRKPAAKRNNKKQDTSNVNLIHTPSTSIALQNTSTSIASNINQTTQQNSTTLASLTNSANSNAINAPLSTAALVPSHIGNIQISQIDANRLAQNTNNMLNTSLASVVDNKIQIMPIIEKIAASTTTTAQIPVQSQQQIVLQNSGMQPHNAATTGTALGDNQAKQMHLVALPQTSNSGSSPAISISNSSTTFTTPTLSIPQQINHTPTNLTATIPTAAMTPVSSQLSGMAANVNVNLSVGSPATIAALLPQLTGSLTLAVSEQCERLILRHDPSQPPDEQSHTIRRALLTGAIANVTIINEPSKVEGINKIPLQIPTPQPNISIASTSCSTTTTSTLGTVSKQTKKVTTQKQNVNANTGDFSSSSKQALKKSPDLGSMTVGSANSSGLSQQQRYVALPKIDPNSQQLFCLNTLNNQITPISPNQTTASIAPTERLLIAPAGINAQQLAQCLQQGQIHFNDVNPPTAQSQPSTTMITQSLNNQQPKQQIVHPLASSANSVPTITTSMNTTAAASATITSITNQTNVAMTTATVTTKQVANVAPIIDQSKAVKQDNKQNTLIGATNTNTSAVQKKKPVRKPKASTTTAADVALMKNATVVKPLPKLDPLSQKPNNNPIQIVQPNTASGKPVTSNPCLTPTSTNVTNTTTSSSNIASVQPFQTTQLASGTKLVGVTAPMQQQTQSNNMIQQQPQNSLNMLRPQGSNGNVFGLGFSSISSISTTITSSTSSNSMNNMNSNMQNGPPSLTSIQQNNINQSTGSSPSTTTPPQQQQQFQPQHTVSRVQTIQLTPQQQQMFRQVQMQIQYLTYKMQHKSMVSSLPLPQEFDANIIAPFNKAMSEIELNTSLQRLFVEQQSILASGKEIPTPEGFITNPGVTGSGPMNFTTLMQPPVLMDNSKSSITNNNATIPANVVQPNNHSNSPNNVNTSNNANNNNNNNNNATSSSGNTSVQQTTQRIHIYPIQHNQHKAKQQKTTQQPPQQQLIPSSQSILNCSTANVINNNNASSNSLTTTTSAIQQQPKTANKPKPSQPTVTSMQQTQQLPPTQTPQLPHPPPPPPLTAQSLQISLSPLLQSAQQQQMINISNMPAMLQQKHFTQHLQQQILQQQQQQQQKLQNAKSPATSLATLNSQNFNISSSSVVGGPPPLIFPNSSIILAQQHHQPAQPLATSTPQLPQPQLPTLSTLPASFTASLTNQKPLIGGNSNIITSMNSSSSTSNSFPNSNSLTTATTLVTMPSLTASSTVVTTSSVTLMQISTSSSTSSFSTSTTSTAAITISSTAAITTPSTSASLTVTASPSIAVAASVSSHSSSGNTGINRFPNSIYVTSNNHNTSSYPDNGVGGTTTTSACVPVIGLKTEDQTQMSPKQKLARLSLFLQQLEVDQRSCLKPDYKNSFQTKEETVKKLIRYHCFYQTDEDIPIEEEEEFERTAQRFQDKFRLLSGKFQEILLQESMLPHRTSELCQMEQLMIEDLRQEIEESRRLEKELKVYEQQQIDYIKHEPPPAQYQNQSSSVGFEQIKNEPKPEPTDNKSSLDITVNGTDSNSNFTNHSQQSTSSSLVSESTFDSIKNEIKTESSNNSQSSQSANKSSNSFLDSFDAQKAPGIANIKQQQQQQQQNQSAPNQMPLTKAAKKEDIFNNWNQSFLESGKTSGNTYYSHLANSVNSMPKPIYSLYNGALKKPLTSQEIKPPVKEEFENFDIESEITPSFIMKKVEPKASTKPPASPATEQQSSTAATDEKTNCNSAKSTPDEDRNSNYAAEQTTQNLISCQKSLPVCSTQIAASNHFVFSNHVNTNNAQSSSCRQHDDDWLCIQKELNLMNNEVNNAPTKVTDVPTQHNASNHQNRNNMGPVTKELEFLTDSSPTDLFPNGCINKGNENKSTTQASPHTNTTTSSCSQQNQQPTAHHMTQSENHQTDLNEFFSGSEDSEIHKSVESRLEAMFSGSPVHISGSKSSSGDNSDDIESGLESIFGEPVKSPTHCGNKHKTTTWDQEIGGTSYIGQSQQQQEQPQQPPAPATFMNAHHMQQQVNSANNARWMQNMEAQLSDFMSTNNTTSINSSSSDCLVAAGRKRSWNGHVMGNESSDMRADENNAHKKLCTNVNGLTSGSSSSSSPLPPVSTHPPHNNSLPTDTSHAQDLMEAALLSLHDGLGVENTATDTATDANGFSHIMSHQNHFGSYNNHLNANSQQNHYVGTNVTHHSITPQDLNNHMLHINHHQSQHQANNHNNATGSGGEFDDDITRHVQNAIDSILNLQSTESDSLPFSLDHSMGSFLSDSILDDRQSTNGQSSCQELAKRRQLVDELTDCLMVNANSAPTSTVVDNAMLMDTSANHAQLMTHNSTHHAQAMHHAHHMNNSGTVAAVTTATAAAAAAAAAINTQHNQINDFSCVVSGIDDAVKSIMSS
uniref:GLTSCR1 domain-containing protein n=1 Tax=Glossina austeni TaxID=7395 RepID=A0A1A9V3F0_GLOAU